MQNKLLMQNNCRWLVPVQVITAPAGSGGFDSSVLLNIDEQLRDENRYDRCWEQRAQTSHCMAPMGYPLPSSRFPEGMRHAHAHSPATYQTNTSSSASSHHAAPVLDA